MEQDRDGTQSQQDFSTPMLSPPKPEEAALLGAEPVEAKAPAASLLLSRSQALALSIKSTVGSGIFAIPFGFRLAGLIGGVLILTLTFALSYIGGLLLLRSRQRSFPGVSRVTYSDVGHHWSGSKGRLLVDSMTVALQIGTIFAYCIFIIETLSNALPSVERAALVVALLLALIPILQLRRIESISLIAAAADILAVVGLISCIVLLVTSRDSGAVVSTSVSSQAWLFVGIALFSVEGVCLVLPVQSSMANPSEYRQVWSWTMLSVFILYLVFGILGYAAFGDSTDDIILNNFATSDIKRATQVIYCLALLLSTAVQAVPAFEIVERNDTKAYMLTIALRLGLAAMAAITTMVVPGFAIVVSLIGAVFGSVMAFGLPAVIVLKLEPGLSRLKRFGLYLLAAISVSSIGLGIAAMV